MKTMITITIIKIIIMKTIITIIHTTTNNKVTIT
jgi:hypothetical protein